MELLILQCLEVLEETRMHHLCSDFDAYRTYRAAPYEAELLFHFYGHIKLDCRAVE